MKKAIRFLMVCLVFAFMAGLIFTPSPTEAAQAKVISLGTSVAGGSWQLVGVALCDIITKHTGITATAEPTGGGDASIRCIKQGDVELGTVVMQQPYEAVRGIKSYAKLGKQPIRLLYSWGYIEYNIVTRKQHGIKTPYDLKGKRVACDLAGAPTIIQYTKDMLGVYGMNVDDIDVLPVTSSKDLSAMLKEKTAHAFIWPIVHRNPTLVELSETLDDFYIVSLNPEKQKAICKELPYYVATSRGKAGTYKGIDYDVNAISQVNGYVCNKDLPVDLVYNIMKAIWEHLPELQKYHRSFKGYSLENALSMPNTPFHPGAIKFYKEKGVWTDELERKNQEMLKEIGDTE